MHCSEVHGGAGLGFGPASAHYIAEHCPYRQFSHDTDLTWQAGPWISAHAQLSCSQEFLHLRRRLGIPCLYIDAKLSIVHL